MLSTRFISLFLISTVILAWMLPSSWITRTDLPPATPTSPWKSVVSIEDVAWGNGAPYVRIMFNDIGAPASISEWSLENERGARAEIGLGVEHFEPGSVPKPSEITIGTGTSVFVAFHPSPLGFSFREHRCSSYLRGTRPFVPPMNAECPLLSEHVGWGSLDSTCKLLIESLPRCTVLSPEHIGDMSPRCDGFLRTVPTYATCLEQVGDDAYLPSWRIYHGEVADMVRETGGTLILRDEHGLVIDTFPYQTIGLK